MNTGHDPLPRPAQPERLAEIEARLSRIEAHLHLPALLPNPLPTLSPPEANPVPAPNGRTEEELEAVVGQQWFAHAGILVLALGAAFALSLPYPGLPAALPSGLGYLLVAGLLLLAQVWRHSFDLISRYLRGAAMALFFFATLRLFYFGAQPALAVDSWFGRLLLLAAVGLNVGLALRRCSPYLLALAVATGYCAALLLNSPAILFVMVTVLSALVAHCWLRHRWPALMLVAIAAAYLVHLGWIFQESILTRQLRVAHEPFASVWCILLYGIVLGIAPLFRTPRQEEDSLDATIGLLNAGGCYALFLFHTVVAFNSALVLTHLVASAVFLGLAVAFWKVRRSQLVCFFYAITGYLALSIAILSAFTVPNVFVWLSLQSVIVVATALWFRSPFIVVANFFIYVAVVLGYMFVAKRETGVSLGFGLVALISARTLNWHKERLQLRTGKMRNAYLASALLIFPYALYHLVPKAYVAVSWVAVAGLYYTLNLVIRNEKYRWMGHLTLLLTVLYLLVIGIIQLPPTHRILSFLVLGTVLVAVSLVFTRRRTRRRTVEEKAMPVPGVTEATVEEAFPRRP